MYISLQWSFLFSAAPLSDKFHCFKVMVMVISAAFSFFLQPYGDHVIVASGDSAAFLPLFLNFS